MQILGLLGMYFDAVVVEVEKNLLLFRLALAILCPHHNFRHSSGSANDIVCKSMCFDAINSRNLQN